MLRWMTGPIQRNMASSLPETPVRCRRGVKLASSRHLDAPLTAPWQRTAGSWEGANLMTQLQRRRIERRMAWVTLTGAVIVAAYWSVYFIDPAIVAGDEPVVRAFESAFPVADIALALLLVVTSRHLFAHRDEGRVLLVAAGAAAIYLGLLDVTFYAGRGLYGEASTGTVIELALNAACLGGGGLAVGVGWTLWRPR